MALQPSMFRFKKNFPTLGDNLEAGTLFPVQLSLKDGEYVEYLKNEHPEQYKLMWEIRERILDVTQAESLSDLNGASMDRDWIEATNERMLKQLFGDEMTMEQMQDRINAYGSLADQVVEDVAQKTMPGYGLVLAMRNEVIATNNLAKLLFMAFDEKNRPDRQVRYEAKRKLEMILALAEIEKSLEPRRKDMEFLIDLWEDRGLFAGGIERKWLVSTHDLDDDNRCTSCEFLDESPKTLADNQLIEPMDCRLMRVKREDGSEFDAFAMFHLRIKPLKAVLLKWMRQPDRPLEELARDHSGVRMIPVNPQEGDDELVRQHLIDVTSAPHPETGQCYDTRIDKVKKGAGGNDGDNPSLRFHKFNMIIGGGDLNEEKDYEFQCFGDKQYVDYYVRLPDAWPVYEIVRLHRSSISETMHPHVHYKGVPRHPNIMVSISDGYMHYLRSRRTVPSAEAAEERQITDTDIMKACKMRAFPKINNGNGRH
ncbi:hypothetical protein JW752_03610 [Candidatus Peregrinibacteria bacterium]|nr:hypothetical protein [Candidatus Peregrinibacteria bacterium]